MLMARAAKKVAPVATANVVDWSRYKIERRKLGQIKPDERNARDHSPEQITQLVSSMVEWGWTWPLLVDEHDKLIAGHGRLEAAKKLNLVEAPVIVARGWTEAQKRAYAVADNRLGETSTWNVPKLRMALSELRLEGADLNLLAFSKAELGRLEKGFSPNLQPMAGSQRITQEDIDKAQTKLGNAFTVAGQQEIVYVECPHCGEKYGINREELKKL
jgi:ParB-like chromosome segregation protein Spo0J